MITRRFPMYAKFACIAAIALTSVAHAQTQNAWTVTLLHPPGATGSAANDVDGTNVVGIALIDGFTLASLWNVPSNVPINLNPMPTEWGAEIAAAGGGQQVGYIDRNEFIPRRFRPRAVLWTGTSGSYVDLQSPVGTAGTMAFGVGGGQQVGISRVGILVSNPEIRASLWSGSTASFVDLHDPTRMFGSSASATDGVQQVGNFVKPLNDPSLGNVRAALWTGTAASLVNLHPIGTSDSQAVAVADGQQVGTVFPDSTNNFYASLWTGSAESWVNLNPAGANASEAKAVARGMQVGWAIFDDGTGMDTGFVYASLWTGTAASWVNLSEFLPAGYIAAEATGIWTDGNATRICGNVVNMNAGARQEAIVWTRTLCPGVPQCCDPIDFNNDSLFPADEDFIDFLSVLAGGPCSAGNTCNDIDFNNDGLFPSDDDLISFLRVLAGGNC